MEEVIIKELDFDLRYVTPVPFLERFFRMYGLEDRNSATSTHIRNLSHEYCRFMLRDSQFLDYKPSQLAAAALVFAINISLSSIASKASIKKIKPEKLN